MSDNNFYQQSIPFSYARDKYIYTYIHGKRAASIKEEGKKVTQIFYDVDNKRVKPYEVDGHLTNDEVFEDIQTHTPEEPKAKTPPYNSMGYPVIRGDLAVTPTDDDDTTSEEGD